MMEHMYRADYLSGSIEKVEVNDKQQSKVLVNGETVRVSDTEWLRHFTFFKSAEEWLERCGNVDLDHYEEILFRRRRELKNARKDLRLAKIDRKKAKKRLLKIQCLRGS